MAYVIKAERFGIDVYWNGEGWSQPDTYNWRTFDTREEANEEIDRLHLATAYPFILSAA